MLCSRSASLMRTTRRSSAIATIILRMFSACCCWSERSEIRPSLVTPSTSLRHLRAELRLHLLGGERGVLDRVVEQGRRDRGGVELEVGEDRRHLHRVVHVVLARQAALARVRAGRALVGPPDDLPVRGLEMVGDPQKL